MRGKRGEEEEGEEWDEMERGVRVGTTKLFSPLNRNNR
jgi:hypothetical protein